MDEDGGGDALAAWWEEILADPDTGTTIPLGIVASYYTAGGTWHRVSQAIIADALPYSAVAKDCDVSLNERKEFIVVGVVYNGLDHSRVTNNQIRAILGTRDAQHGHD